MTKMVRNYKSIYGEDTFVLTIEEKEKTFVVNIYMDNGKFLIYPGRKNKNKYTLESLINAYKEQGYVEVNA